MPLTANEVSAAIALQLREFRFPAALDALKRQLIEPHREDRIWEYDDRERLIECWLTAQLKDEIGIAYSLEAYGPSKPWGVVYTDTHDHLWAGILLAQQIGRCLHWSGTMGRSAARRIRMGVAIGPSW